MPDQKFIAKRPIPRFRTFFRHISSKGSPNNLYLACSPNLRPCKEIGSVERRDEAHRMLIDLGSPTMDPVNNGGSLTHYLEY